MHNEEGKPEIQNTALFCRLKIPASFTDRTFLCIRGDLPHLKLLHWMDLDSALSSAFQLLPLALWLSACVSTGCMSQRALVTPTIKTKPVGKKVPHLYIPFPSATASKSEIKLAEENIWEKVRANESCTRFFGFTRLEGKSIALGKQELVEL